MQSDLVNGLYGAIGIGPVSGGMCKSRCSDGLFLTKEQIMYPVKPQSLSQ